MKLKVSILQLIMLILGSAIGTYIGYKLTPTYWCVTGPCISPSPVPNMFIGLIISSLVIYSIELLYNNLVKKS
jgi:hypothetical protein